MKQKMFSIFDSKACFFGPIFFEQREESAMRAFADSVNNPDPKNGFYTHPEDYSLYYLGEFDNEVAEFDVVKARNLVTASSLATFESRPGMFKSNGKDKEPATK